MLPIWPKGFTAALDDQGRLEVRDDENRVVAVEGAPFETGGGYVVEFQPPDKVEPRDEQIQRLEERLGAPIPDRCLGTGVYGAWLVFDIEPR